MILYGFLGCGIVIALLSGGLWMQTERLDIAQGSMEVCGKEKDLIGTQLIAQNRAVKGLENAAKERTEAAKAALSKARKDSKAQTDEIARLRGLNAKSCGEAVAGVKRGMVTTDVSK